MAAKAKLPWIFDCIQKTIQQQDLNFSKTSNGSNFSWTIDTQVKSTIEELVAQTNIKHDDTFRRWLEQSSEDSIIGCGPVPIGNDEQPADTNRCWYWIPGELQSLPTHAIVSSHLGKDWTKYPDKLDAIRTAVARMAADGFQLFTAENTTTDLLARRAAQWFDIPSLYLRRLKRSTKPDWYLEQINASQLDVATTCFVWPEDQDSNGKQSWLDSLVIENADRLLAISVRHGGTIERELTKRLATASAGRTTTFIFQARNDNDACKQLVDNGAIPWLLVNDQQQPTNSQKDKLEKVRGAVVPVDNIDWSDWLIHLTRAQPNAWPDQSEGDFLDGLLFGADSRDCLATLMRMISQARINGGQDLIRGHFPMVCFSDTDPKELIKNRTFRSHLNRWDYEPYGVAIHKRHIESIGGRPVIYGDQCTWNVMKDSERPFFQKNESLSDTQKLDWSKEKEWRVFGDVELNRAAIDDVIVLVDSEQDAAKIAPLSRWLVVTFKSNASPESA